VTASIDTLARDALEAFQRGQWTQASQLAAQVLAAQPAHFEAGQIRTLSELNAGRSLEALPHAESLLRFHPSNAFAHNSLGGVLDALGRSGDAADAFRHAAEIAPQLAVAWLNLGKVCLRMRQYPEAADALERAVRFGDAQGSTRLQWAASLVGQGRDDEALRVLQEAGLVKAQSELDRDAFVEQLRTSGAAVIARQLCEDARAAGNASAAMLVTLALAQLQAGGGDEALDIAREALARAPNSVPAAEAAARAELRIGNLDAAVAGFARLEALDKAADRWRFLGAVAWPQVMESREQIATRFAQVHAALDDLVARPATLSDPFVQVNATCFYMAYQGFDDTDLQRKVAQAYRLACPALESMSSHVNRPRPKNRKIRVGIISANLNNHTIGKLNIGIAQKLDRARFEMFILRPPGPADFLSAAFDQCASRAVTLPTDLAAARAKVAEAELDAIFYPDVGMDAFTYYLAYSRLARLQFTTLGHPVTTGMPNMDAFIAAHDAEPPDGQRFYTERLVRFTEPPSYYYAPREPSSFDLRAHLDIPADARIYASLQTIYKMHPDFDSALVQILRRDRRGRVVLMAGRHEPLNARLRARIAREGPDVVDRIHLMAQVPMPDYFAALGDADAVLDTFHFGGGLSSFESFAMSAPVVTFPGERMRARLTLGLYARMGVSRWVARSPEHFVDLALELADGSDRESWGDEVRERARHFVENDTVVREYEGFIERSLDA
jgi:predicted O-linked N-acetylglucosamine transferase (SPINDLY family)